MASPYPIEGVLNVVGGRIFSPVPPKRVLGESFMQDSGILPCDREFSVGSPFPRKAKDAETALTASYVETDSVISSCMLTSESFYGQPDLLSASERANSSIETGYATADDSTQSIGSAENRPEGTATIHWSPKVKQRRRQVDWGDRSSIRLSIEYPQTFRLTSANGDGAEKNYFKICFATEFSDDDDEEENASSAAEVADETGENGQTPTNCVCMVTSSQSVVSPSSSFCTSFNRKRKPPLFKVRFLSPQVENLIGPVETEDGLFSLKCLEPFSLAQIQLIANDLMNQIDDKNGELMDELPLRDDLKLELDDRRSYLDNYASKMRAFSTRSNFFSPQPPPPPSLSHRPRTLSSAFNPHPEYRYPFNSPPHAFYCPPPSNPRQPPNTPSVGARFKSYVNRFFSVRRQPTDTGGRDGQEIAKSV